MQNKPLVGRRALVTAGASGIGKAAAMALADAGCTVHICDIDPAFMTSCLEERPDITGTLADIGNEADIHRVFEDADRRLGGLDILFNNAGIGGPSGRVDTLKSEDWRRTIDVNLTGQFLCAQQAVPRFLSAGGGTLVNMSSVAGRLAYPNRTPYAATKWAIVGLTKTLAVELGPLGIRCNALMPGVVAGPRIERLIQNRAAEAGRSPESVRDELLGKVSLRQMVTAEDVARMVVYLCSPAGQAISGQAISICGNVESL